jgi:hypothetical protein
METIARTEAAERFDHSPEAMRLNRRSAPPVEDGAISGAVNAGGGDDFSERLKALERKTATGLDTLMSETQNIDTPKPIAAPLPTMEAPGTTEAVPAPSDPPAETTETTETAETDTNSEFTNP